MLLASPQERRIIFEEAAGIAKYKQRRIEAQRKLDRAMTNLVGTREQLESTERRLRLVRGQAAKARRFKDLDEQLRALRTALAFEQYDELRQRLDGLTSRQAELETVRHGAQHALGETEVAKQEAELTRSDLQNRHRTAEQERMRLVFAASQASQRREMTLRSVQEARTRSEEDAARLGRLRESLASVEGGITAQGEDVAALAERRQECERTLSTAAQERAGVLETLNEIQSAAGAKRSALARIDRDRSGLLASLAAEERQATQVREQIERIESKHASAGADLESLKQKAAASATLASELVEAAGTIDASVKDAQQRLELLGRGRAERSKALSQAEQEFARTESRRVTLREMAESRVGYAEAVRAVMAKRAVAAAG
jgi:chromosome segregation protein